ncbi:unnamed protein product [Trichogramma brassicae]|uniref:Uncharacterized protein n=1 Tax=Trichogramma brassicae TaxID=86971 RepID=A0A6H5I9K5_9HYME|nr:unnamed protein product [Trichogramma brassicae]
MDKFLDPESERIPSIFFDNLRISMAAFVCTRERASIHSVSMLGTESAAARHWHLRHVRSAFIIRLVSVSQVPVFLVVYSRYRTRPAYTACTRIVCASARMNYKEIEKTVASKAKLSTIREENLNFINGRQIHEAPVARTNSIRHSEGSVLSPTITFARAATAAVATIRKDISIKIRLAKSNLYNQGYDDALSKTFDMADHPYFVLEMRFGVLKALRTTFCACTRIENRLNNLHNPYMHPLENVEAVSRLLLTFDPGSRTKQRETEDMPETHVLRVVALLYTYSHLVPCKTARKMKRSLLQLASLRASSTSYNEYIFYDFYNFSTDVKRSSSTEQDLLLQCYTFLPALWTYWLRVYIETFALESETDFHHYTSLYTVIRLICKEAIHVCKLHRNSVIYRATILVAEVSRSNSKLDNSQQKKRKKNEYTKACTKSKKVIVRSARVCMCIRTYMYAPRAYIIGLATATVGYRANSIGQRSHTSSSGSSSSSHPAFHKFQLHSLLGTRSIVYIYTSARISASNCRASDARAKVAQFAALDDNKKLKLLARAPRPKECLQRELRRRQQRAGEEKKTRKKTSYIPRPDSSDPFEESPAFLCLAAEDAEDGYIDLHALYDQLSEFTCTRVEQTILQIVTQAPPAKSQLVFAIALSHSFLPRSRGSRLLANCIHISGRKFPREENAEKRIFRALLKRVDKKPAKARNLVGRFGK